MSFLFSNDIERFLPTFSVAASGDCVRNCDEQEVWHDHHDLHWAEHVDHDLGPLRPERDVGLCLGEPQHGLHLHLHHRMRPEDLRSSASLLQRTMEYFWFCCCYFIHSWWVFTTFSAQFQHAEKPQIFGEKLQMKTEILVIYYGLKIKALENWTKLWQGRS